MKWPNGFGPGRPNSSARNCADSCLSREATMVWLKLIDMVLPSQPLSWRRDNARTPVGLLRRRELQGYVVRVAELQDVRRPDVFDGLMLDAAFVEMRGRGVQFGLAAQPERDVVEADAILVEAVRGDRPQPEQRTAEVVDDATEQEAELVAGGFVCVLGDLQQHRPTEDALVELARSLDIGDGQPDVRDGATGKTHLVHAATWGTRC